MLKHTKLPIKHRNAHYFTLVYLFPHMILLSSKLMFFLLSVLTPTLPNLDNSFLSHCFIF